MNQIRIIIQRIVNYTCQDIYDYFVIKRKSKIKKKLYQTILDEYNNEIVRQLILGNQYVLPYGFGRIYIKKSNVKLKLDENFNIDIRRNNGLCDYGTTNKVWKENEEFKNSKRVIYYENLHTDGDIMKFFWDKRKVNIKNVQHIKFGISQSVREQLAISIKRGDRNQYYI